MKIAVINFSGNVGKSAIARHLIWPRIPGAEFIAVNSEHPNDLSTVVRGKQWGDLKEYLMQMDDAVVDIGASNVVDMIKSMKQHRGSHAEFDYFVVPTVKEAKQQRDTIATIDALAALGVPAKQIRLVFNKTDPDEAVASCFGALLAYCEAEKKFTVSEKAAVEANEVFWRLEPLGKTLAEVLADETNYRAALSAANDPEEKRKHINMIAVKQLAVSANENLNAVHKALFGHAKTEKAVRRLPRIRGGANKSSSEGLHIKRKTLAALQQAGVQITYAVVGCEEGVTLQATVGDEVRVLQTTQGNTRYFRTLDAAARILTSLGVDDFVLDMGPWQPKKTDRT